MPGVIVGGGDEFVVAVGERIAVAVVFVRGVEGVQLDGPCVRLGVKSRGERAVACLGVKVGDGDLDPADQLVVAAGAGQHEFVPGHIAHLGVRIADCDFRSLGVNG